jgi:hypothetical protein
MSETKKRSSSLAADGFDDWAASRERKFTFALQATPAQRLEWLEQMIALAWQSGALPRPRRE